LSQPKLNIKLSKVHIFNLNIIRTYSNHYFRVSAIKNMLL